MQVGGLVGYCEDGTITQCYANGVVKGGDALGGLVGYCNGGTITQCYANGVVKGHDAIYGDAGIGGLVGRSYGGTITQCYANGVVKGYELLGGLVGYCISTAICNCFSQSMIVNESTYSIGGLVGYLNAGTVDSCYAAGRIVFSGDFPAAMGFGYNSYLAGGLVGRHDGSAQVSNSYWDAEASASYVYGNEMGFRTGQMCWPYESSQVYAGWNFCYAGWDFYTVWEHDSSAQISGGYPFLRAFGPLAWTLYFDSAGGSAVAPIQQTAGVAFPVPAPPSRPGYIFRGWEPPLPSVMPARNVFFRAQWAPIPIAIASIGELQKIGNDAAYPLDGHYYLTQDIDASECATWMDFQPIGTSVMPFVGFFDGRGHVISNLWIDRPTQDYVGLLGYVGSGGVVRALGLAGGNVTGRNNSGALVGTNEGSIDQVWSSCAVSGQDTVGGLIGDNQGVLTNAYARGNVTGEGRVAGLAGRNYGTIRACLATGVVSGSSSSGGLVAASSYDKRVYASYWDQQSSGQNSSAGGEGRTSAELTSSGDAGNTYVGWDFASVWIEDDPLLVNGGYPYLRACPAGDALASTLLLYDDNGLLLQAISLLAGSPLPAIPAPKRPGYSFTGWEPPLPETMPAENLEVVATWGAGRYHLTFVSGDDGVFIGGEREQNHVLQYGEALPPVPEVVPRTGLVFAGWDGEIPTTLSGDLKLTALYALDLADCADDLLSDSWVQLHFGADGAFADDDPDEDGYNNWEEFVSNTDPNDSQDHPADRAIPIWHDAVYKLRTIGQVLRRYADEHGYNVFPGRLQYLVDDGYLPAAALASIGDESFGTDPHPHTNQFSETHEPGVSFFYEMSEAPCRWARMDTSWYETKMQQFQSGSSWPIMWDEGRGPFDRRAFPVVRCFWVPDDLGKRHVTSWATSLNLAMDLKTVFASTSEWEDQSTIILPDDAPVLRLAANDFYSYPIQVSHGDTIRIPLWFAVKDVSSSYELRLVPPEDENQTIYGELHDSYYLYTPGWDTPGEFTVRVEWHDGEALRYANFSIMFTDWPPAISFDSAGGTPVEEIRAMPGEPLQAPTPPTRPGYTFLGWTPPLPETMPAENLEVVAIWAANLSFNSAGGTPVEDIWAVPGDPLQAPTPPTRQGYTFLGWEPPLPETMPAESLEVVATWAINLYNLTFVSGDDGVFVGGEREQKHVLQYGEALPPAPVVVPRAGLVFAGWDGEIPTTLSGDLKLTALYALDLADCADDLLPGSWVQLHFGEDGAFADDDPDGDGYSNWEEFVSNTDPSDPQDHPADRAIPIWHDAVYKLRTIGQALQRYTDENRYNVFPGRLQFLVDDGYLPAAALASIGDESFGTDPHPYDNDQFTAIYEPGISFYYRMNEAQLSNLGSAHDLAMQYYQSGEMFWGADSQQEPRPFSQREFPIVSDFWLLDSRRNDPLARLETLPCLNLAMDLKTVFASTSEWEISGGLQPDDPLEENASLFRCSVPYSDTIRILLWFACKDVSSTYGLRLVPPEGEDQTIYGELHGLYYLYTPGRDTPENFTVRVEWHDGDALRSASFDISVTDWPTVLCFDSAGSTPLEDIWAMPGEPLQAPTPPTRHGYTFLGWTPPLPETMPAENLEVVATWAINLYNLTFVSGDDGVFVGGEYEQTLIVSHGEATPPAPEVVPRAGLVFVGWDGEIPTTLSGDLKLTALYALDLADGADDLLPDSWVLLHFGEDGAASDDDPDEDGYSNWEEFVSNTDPNDAQDYPVDPAIPIWHDAVYKLRTIGQAIQRYADEHGYNVFPGRLQYLVDDGYLPAAALASIGDESLGADPHPHTHGQFFEAYEPGVSFFYEMSEAPCSWSDIGTWYETKMQQFQSGANWRFMGDEYGSPFDPRAFPVVRCFWVPDDLGKWRATSWATSLNLAMDLKTVFASTLQWEDQSTIILPDDASVLRLAANDFYSYPIQAPYGDTIRIPLWFAVKDVSSSYELRLVPPEGENQTIYGELHGSYYLYTPGKDTPGVFTVRVEWHDGEALCSANFSIKVTDWPPVICFDSAGGTPVEEIWGMPGEPLQAPTPPTRYGYTFLGWTPPLPETMPNYAMMVKARWMLNTYTLTYVAEGHGSVNGQNEYRQHCDHGSDGLPVTAQPAGGYRFVRWSDGVQSVTRSDTNVQGDLTVIAEFAAKFTPAITWAAPEQMMYGERLSAAQLAATADTPGVFVYDPPVGTQLASGTHTLRVTFTPEDAVNWSPVEASVELTVARAMLTVTAGDMTRRVGQGNPAFTCVATGLIGDDTLADIGLDVTYACAANEQSAAGDYAITPSGPAETANYAITYVPGVLKVLPKDIPTITWAAPEQIVYGEALSTAQLTAAADTPGVFVYDPPLGTALASGRHTLRVTFTPEDAVNWSPAEASVELTVARAELTVTADDMTRRVGQGNPAFSVTVDGLLGDDSLAGIGLDVVYTCIADEQSAAGDYAITPSGTAETANYAVTYVPGVLKVLPKDIPVITWAAPEQMMYGERLSAAQLAATADTPGVFVYDPPVGTQLASGTHTLRVTFTPEDAVNWSPVEASVELVVARTALTVTADDLMRRVGQDNPAFTCVAAGLVGNDTLANIGLDVSYTCVANDQSAPGDYAITPSGPAETANYAVTYVPGVLKVLPKDIPVITWAIPGQIVYGEALSTVQLAATADTLGVFVYDPPVGTQLASGRHTLRVTFTPEDAVNWSPAEASVELTVARAELTVTADDMTRRVGQGNPAFTCVAAGLVGNDTLANIGLDVSYTCVANDQSAPGDYAITPSGPAETANYAVTYVLGVLKVQPKDIPVITWAAPGQIVYGETLSATQLSATADTPGVFVYDPPLGTQLAFGTHTLRVTFTPEDAVNWSPAEASVELTVARAELTVTADDMTRRV
ncbi:MAG: MBG domain-containing protein, partial [Lentisphaeria bacterium]